MTYRRHPLLLLFVVISCSLGRSQEAGSATSVQSVHRNFLGSWEGESDRVVGGRLVHEIIELVVTEEPKKHRLRFDFHRNNGSIPDGRRFLNLDPSNEIVTMQWEGFPKDRCTASGLKEFAQSGLGDFTAICHSEADRRMDRMTLHLGIDTLEYEWATSADGKTYEVYSKFSFKRRPKHDNVSLQDAGRPIPIGPYRAIT